MGMEAETPIDPSRGQVEVGIPWPCAPAGPQLSGTSQSQAPGLLTACREKSNYFLNPVWWGKGGEKVNQQVHLSQQKWWCRKGKGRF